MRSMNIELLQPCTDAYLWNFEHTTAPCSVFTAHGHLTTIDFNDRWSLWAFDHDGDDVCTRRSRKVSFHFQSLAVSCNCKTGRDDKDNMRTCSNNVKNCFCRQVNLLGGGCYTGQVQEILQKTKLLACLTQVCWFDDRAGRQPVGVTDFLQSHKDAVYTVRYNISQSE